MRSSALWEFFTPFDMVHLSSYLYEVYSEEADGDGHTVIVLPGFCAGPQSTSVLRQVLSHKGYNAIDWGQGVNLGPCHSMDENLEALLQKQEERVTLVGWSLGGLMARVLAHKYTDKIRRVITLGSPHRADVRDSALLPLFKLLSPRDVLKLTTEEMQWVRTDPPVPLTSVYTQTDGIVDWEDCISDSENIVVHGSHLGMTHNPDVLRIILERLAQ